MRIRGAFLIAASLTWGARAGAQPRPLDLSWRAGPECPSAAYVLGEVGRILGETSEPRRPVVASAEVERIDGGTWRVTLITRSEDVSGRRSFAAESCLALADATALILAMTVNPHLATTAAIPTAIPTAIQATTPATDGGAPPFPPPDALARTTTPTAAPRSRDLARADHAFSLTGSLAVDSGTLPTATIGAELAVTWHPGRFQLEIAGSYWPARRETAPTSARDGADFNLLTVGARGTYLFRAGPIAVGPRLGFELDRVGASGFGGTTSFDQSATSFALQAGGLVVWAPLPNFALRLAVQGVAPLARPSFVVIEPAPAPATPVHRPAPVAARAMLGAQWQFF